MSTEPVVLPQLISEVETVYKTLSDYSEALAAYVFSPSLNPLPELDVADLKIDELLALAQQSKDSAVDITAGAITRTIYKAVGTIREVDARSYTKAMIYDKAISQLTDSSEDLRGQSGKTVSELRSTTPNQSEGI